MNESGETPQKPQEAKETYCRFGPEAEDVSIKDIVIIRPPIDVGREGIDGLARQLNEKNFLPVILLEAIFGEGIIWGKRFFPSDYLREVGPWVFRSEDQTLDEVLNFAEGRVNLERFRGRVKNMPGNFRGGDFVYLPQKKVFVYAQDRVEKEQVHKIFKTMRENGWKLYPVETEDIRVEGQKLDLDFLLSLFWGKDGKVHAIAPLAFADRVPKDFKTHLISDEEVLEEVLRGGCNIADLRNGKCLVLPNKEDTPDAHRIIERYKNDSIEVLETPQNFIESDGGPRCSITSFSI